MLFGFLHRSTYILKKLCFNFIFHTRLNRDLEGIKPIRFYFLAVYDVSTNRVHIMRASKDPCTSYLLWVWLSVCINLRFRFITTPICSKCASFIYSRSIFIFIFIFASFSLSFCFMVGVWVHFCRCSEEISPQPSSLSKFLAAMVSFTSRGICPFDQKPKFDNEGKKLEGHSSLAPWKLQYVESSTPKFVRGQTCTVKYMRHGNLKSHVGVLCIYIYTHKSWLTWCTKLYKIFYIHFWGFNITKH